MNNPQIADLRTTLQQQSSALEVLQRSEAASADNAAHLEREKALLVSDKAFLQSELRNSEQQCDDKSRENEGNVTRRNALEAKVPQSACLSFSLLRALYPHPPPSSSSLILLPHPLLLSFPLPHRSHSSPTSCWACR